MLLCRTCMFSLIFKNTGMYQSFILSQVCNTHSNCRKPVSDLYSIKICHPAAMRRGIDHNFMSSNTRYGFKHTCKFGVVLKFNLNGLVEIGHYAYFPVDRICFILSYSMDLRWGHSFISFTEWAGLQSSLCKSGSKCIWPAHTFRCY